MLVQIMQLNLKMENKIIKNLTQKLERYAKKEGFKLNPDKSIVKMNIKGMLKNKKKFGELYCSCRLVTKNKEKDKQIICPCIFHKKEIKSQGHCHCGLFVQKDKESKGGDKNALGR